MFKEKSIAIFSIVLLTGSATAQAPRTAKTLASSSQRQVSFFENKGQAPGGVLWQARGSGFEVLFLRDSFVLRESTAKPGAEVLEQRIWLASINAEARIEPLDILPGKFSFFRGRDPHGWVRGLSTYGRLRYKDIYPGIDLLFYGNHGKLEYDFVVAAGADPGQIRLRVEGTKRVTERGELQLGEGAQVTLHRPLLYQNIDRGKRIIEGRFVSLTDGRLSFECGSYDPKKTLVIDPTVNLLYATSVESMTTKRTRWPSTPKTMLTSLASPLPRIIP